MKTLPRFLVFVLAIFASQLVAAEVQPPAPSDNPSRSDKPSIAGDFVGTWRTDTDTGKLRLSIKQNGETWSAETSFTFQDAEIPAKVTRLKVEGTSVELVVAWMIQETPGQSRMTGELAGAKIDGTFQSETPDGTSNGTWSVTRT